MNGLTQPIEVAVVGVGQMGKRHARAYTRLPQAKLVAVVDQDTDRAAALADDLGCQAFADAGQLLHHFPRLGAVSVAVPTVLHAQVARPFIEKGVACLVEKPLAATPQEAKALAELARRHGVILQVGHTERFNPAVQAVAQLGIQPRFMEVQRISPMTFRSLDVGVVMDMMIHDLDIVLTLAGSPLHKVEAIGVAVLGQHEDVANARLVFASGCVANLTASRLALKSERKLRIFSEDAYVSLDYAKRNGVVIRKSENADVVRRLREQLASGADLGGVDYSGLVRVDELAMDSPPAPGTPGTPGSPDSGSTPSPGNIPVTGGGCDPLTAELIHFLDAVKGGFKPLVDADAGFAAVEAAQRVMNAIAAHKWEGLERFSI